MKSHQKNFFSQLGFNKDYQNIETNYLDTCLVLDDEFIPLTEKLKNNYNFAMLSNDVSNWSKHLRHRFDLDKYFITAIISGDVHSRKPSHEIYQALLTKTGYLAHECVFIDDSIKNLNTAKVLGFKTIWFNRNKEKTKYDGHTIDNLLEISDVVDAIF